MHLLRPSIYVACVAVLAFPHAADATTSPTLTSPSSGDASFVQGASIEFSWAGTLQGDPDTLDRSFYRLEVAPAADVPMGTQTAWEDTEDFRVTTAGADETSATMGVPKAGSYKWRVCAWGIVDDAVSNAVQQMPNGCSPARSFTTVVGTTSTGTVTELEQRTTVTREGAVQVVEVDRPSTSAPATATPPVGPAPIDVHEVQEPLAPAGFQEVVRRTIRGSGSAVGMSTTGLDVDSAGSKSTSAEGGGARVGQIVSRGLSATLPFVPIPYWTLGILLCCIPIARMWRRSVIGMFEWPDGTIDGSGMVDVAADPLRSAADGTCFKQSAAGTDSDAHALPPPGSDRVQILA